jgi:hypothetical protein
LRDFGDQFCWRQKDLQSASSFPQLDCPNRFHHFRHINAFRTTGCASHASDAKPRRLAGENFLRHAQLQKPHDLVRQQVSRETQRATGRTLPALITGVKVLPTQFLNLAQDFAAQP